MEKRLGIFQRTARINRIQLTTITTTSHQHFFVTPFNSNGNTRGASIVLYYHNYTIPQQEMLDLPGAKRYVANPVSPYTEHRDSTRPPRHEKLQELS